MPKKILFWFGVDFTHFCLSHYLKKEIDPSENIKKEIDSIKNTITYTDKEIRDINKKILKDSK